MIEKKFEIWSNGKEDLILLNNKKDCHYLKFSKGTYWVAGITLYWLLSNGYKQYE